MLPSNKPRVFVSSTISDFRDLRSALKYWLSEMGCEVWMSEFNDFVRRPDLRTFDSCFDLVRRSDYFVLLVGGRRGGLYDDANGISVTQQEFRVAREAFALGGRPVPVLLVRSDVLAALREWQAIRGSREENGAAKHVPCRSGVLMDPVFVERFVADLGSVDATERQRGELWRNEFSSFSDLVDALRVSLSLHRPLRRQALLANLRWELEENLTELCRKLPDRSPFPVYMRLSRLRSQQPLLDLASRRDSVILELGGARDALAFWLSMPAVHSLQHSMLDQAILSGEFLVYSHEHGGFTQDSMCTGLWTLASTIRSYAMIYSLVREQDSEFASACEACRSGRQRVSFSSNSLLLLCRAHDLLEDITSLSSRLLRYALDPDSGFRLPALNPTSPIPGMDVSIANERATHEEVSVWIREVRSYCQIANVECSQSEINEVLDSWPDLRSEFDRMLGGERGGQESARPTTSDSGRTSE